MRLADLGNNGTFGWCSRGGAENEGERADVVNEWRDVCEVTAGNGEETVNEEEVIEDSSISSSSSEPEEPAMAGTGGMLGGVLL